MSNNNQKETNSKQKNWKDTLKVETHLKRATSYEEVLFDEELYPEFKKSDGIRTYFKEIER